MKPLLAIIVFDFNLAGISIKFGREPEGAPVECKYFIREEDKLPTGRPLEGRDVLSWEHYSTTESSWKHLSDEDRWVPIHVQLGMDQNLLLSDCEYTFADWKFRTSIDSTLLEKGNFILEKIVKSVDFDRIDEDIDASIAEVRKSKK